MLRSIRSLSCFSEMLQYLFLASFVQICCGQAVTTIDASLPKQVELYSTQTISCDINGTLTSGVRWIRSDAVFVSSCSSATSCLPNSGYNIPEATATRNVLEIVNTTVKDGGEWTCKDGAAGLPSSGRLDVIKNSSTCVINSTSSLDNVEQGSQVTLMVYIKQYYCSATPLFQLGNANVNLSRTPTGLDDNEGSATVNVTRSETLDLYMVCGGAPLKQNCNVNLTTATSTSPSQPTETTTTTLPASPTTTNNTSAAPVPVPEACGFALIAVIILVVLLVMKIATDVIFVAYRWGDKCEQIIDTDKRKYILYWICFVQGIINSICGVTFFIVIFATCSESLGEGLPIAAIVIGIIVGSIGVINIVMCLCCCCCPKSSDPGKSDDPSPWLCCCCLGTIHPKDKSSRDHPPPSSLPPIPPSMASPRKPVPPSSTTARTLPSPTSDPASDSAVHPTVHLEPLSVEEPKKKKKKRKKRKKINEAGGETSDQLKNPAGDSDE